MPSQIRLLLDLINKNVSLLEELCEADGTNLPDLHTPFHPSSEAFRANPDVAEACNITIAAAYQLAAILSPPFFALSRIFNGFLNSAALRLCIESNVTEILREAGPQGLHVNDIAKLNNQNPRKLSQFMRLLTLHHIYREVTPEVFTNTRFSSVFDTLKPSKEIIADPEHKHDNTNGIAAVFSHILDEIFKGAAYVWETFSDPKLAHSGEPTDTAIGKALGFKGSLWSFYSQPEEQFRQNRFGIAMRGHAALQPADAVLNFYNWKGLPAGSMIVDVGGGIGSVTYVLAKHFPDFRFVVQDRPPVINDAKKWWATNLPDAMESGRVTFQAHDFFTSQPQKSATIFLLRQILHDWSDDYCLKILTQLRAAATPQTQLVLMESIISYACRDPFKDEKEVIPGALAKEAPEPLLANYGVAQEEAYAANVNMCLCCNSQERTFLHFDHLLRSTGWKLSRVNRQAGNSTFVHTLIAVPM